jgi:glycosyltransferase involved in cell wall biosynthesis
VKVLHVVESLGRGAVEAWLVRMLAHGRRRAAPLDWTFYCSLERGGALADKAHDLGARIIVSPAPLDRQAAFVDALRAELKSGDYDVLHCHHDLVSGLYLAAAFGLPISRRIVHVHNADESVLTPSRWKQGLYRPVLRRACLGMADRIVGISNHTLDTFLAGRRRRPGRDLVHYYGVDPAPFTGPAPDRAAFRRELGLDVDAPMLLFGGRLTPEKNPAFAVDVFAELARRRPSAALVFAGAGSESSRIRERAVELGVASQLRMLGWRDDLASVMRCADWFILPRPEQPMEGFGLAVVEAQLAGLRLLLSRGVPDDPLLPTAQFRRLALADGPRAWAQAAEALLEAQPAGSCDALEAIARSPMDMDFALRQLLELHGSCSSLAGPRRP